jgi:hypothetical protein
MRPTIAVAAVLAIALAACGEDAGTVGPSGIQGRALAGPQCPVEVAVTPCPDRPWEGVVTATDVDTGRTASVRTDPGGRFRLALEPGTYDVSIDADADLPFARPQRITVHAGEFTDVTVAVDTGIR